MSHSCDMTLTLTNHYHDCHHHYRKFSFRSRFTLARVPKYLLFRCSHWLKFFFDSCSLSDPNGPTFLLRINTPHSGQTNFSFIAPTSLIFLHSHASRSCCRHMQTFLRYKHLPVRPIVLFAHVQSAHFLPFHYKHVVLFVRFVQIFLRAHVTIKFSSCLRAPAVDTRFNRTILQKLSDLEVCRLNLD